MSEYFKRGAAVRWENGTLVRTAECGVAVEGGGEWRCRPSGEPGLEMPGAEAVLTAVKRVESAVPAPLRIERLVVAEGVAEHRCGGRTWSERVRRLHLSIVAGRERALVHIGGFEEEDVREVADALLRCDGAGRPAPPRLRLAPRVTAAILPQLAGLAPPNVALMQTAGAVDGRGADVEELRVDQGPWPNWYRPSYRVPPVRMPFDLRLVCDVEQIDASRPRAVALLTPPQGLILRVLVDDGIRSWPSTVRVTRVDAVARERIWYPFAAGSFGSEVML